MKIEKINDNQIRCTLNKYDLASRQIKISELAYGSDKAKMLFRDMMQQASAEFGFEAEDIPLMIEAIPISADCIVLMITKVEDPEELDTRFSKFAPSGDDDELDVNSDLNDIMQVASEFLKYDPQASKSEDVSEDSQEDLSDNPEFVPLKDSLEADLMNKEKFANLIKAMDNSSTKKAEKSHLFEIVFSFDSLDDIINLAATTGGKYTGNNSLYKSLKDSRYYLFITKGNLSTERYAVLCNILSEYGKIEKYNYATKSYFEEHFKRIISKNALQKLSTLA